MEQVIGDGVDQLTNVTQILDAHRLRSHAKEALLIACRHSHDHTIDACAALWGVLAATTEGGQAFPKLRQLVGREPPRAVRQVDSPEQVYLNGPLLASLRVAHEFWRRRGEVRGRDFVTWALLARDPSLDRWLGTPVLTQLRARWFEFVAEDEPWVWASWWNAAGIPLPSPNTAAATNAELWAKLSLSSRRALAHANAMRLAMHQPKVHMEQLIAGLQAKHGGPTERAFVAAGLDAAGFRKLAQEVTRQTLPAEFPPAELTSLPELSKHAREALLAASRLSKDGTIHSHELFAGAMAIADCEIVKALAKLGVRPERHDGQSASESAHELAPDPAVAAQVAGFRSDGVTDQTDLLDIKQDVTALASVIAAREVEPPLSIGLFGDWGSGKSFFIDSMKKQITRIAKAAEEAEQTALTENKSPADATRYCARIAQLEFNAWRYIDTELWASLADGIIDGLSRAMEDPAHIDTTATERARLLAAAARSRDVIGETEARRATAEGNLARQQQVLQQAEARNSASQRGKAAIEQEARLLAVSANDALKSELVQVTKTLGTDARTNEAMATLLELQETWGLAKGVWRSIRARSIWAFVGALLLAALGYLMIELEPLLDQTIESLLAAAGALGSLLVGLGPYVKKALAAAQQVRKIVETHEAALEDATKQATEADQAKRDRLEAEVNSARQLVEEAQSDLEEIQSQLLTLHADAQMAKFLKERRESDDYRKHFGVIGRARNDFERLSELLFRTRDETPREGLPRIDRIVLYIDDLDRCSEKQVVDVLQAVHLLLAFKLFVVVVAVDSRWLLRSLQREMSAVRLDFQVDQGISEEEQLHWQSTPLNYLEKIFQIPFTLKAVGKDGFGNMIDHLTAPPIEKGQLTNVQHPPTRGGESNAGDQPPAVQPEAEQRVSGAVPVRPSTPFEQQQARPSPPPSASETDEPLDMMPHHLEFAEWEKAFMRDFYELISTPRAIKRFVNVYRLLKARVPDERVEVLRGVGKQGEYSAAIFLLALLVGYPSEATDMMRDLTEETSTEAWWEWLEKFLSKAKAEAAEKQTGESSAQRAERLAELQRRLERLRVRLDKTSVALPASDVFRHWTPYVARFSFQAGRLGGATTTLESGRTPTVAKLAPALSQPTSVTAASS